MNQHKIMTVAGLAVSFISYLSLSSMPAFAQYGTAQVAATTKVNDKGVMALATVRVNADKEIDRRITVLTKLVANLGVLKRVSDTQKASLTAQVQSEITSLTNLKAKIDSDSDLATLRADKKSIVDSYRVFLLFVPEVTITIHADQILATASVLQTLSDKLSARISAATTAGKDMTSANASLTEMNSKILDAITQSNNAVTTVSSLSPSGYPGNKTALTDARKMLATARTDLRAARQDAGLIRTSLKTK